MSLGVNKILKLRNLLIIIYNKKIYTKLIYRAFRAFSALKYKNIYGSYKIYKILELLNFSSVVIQPQQLAGTASLSSAPFTAFGEVPKETVEGSCFSRKQVIDTEFIKLPFYIKTN